MKNKLTQTPSDIIRFSLFSTLFKIGLLKGGKILDYKEFKIGLSYVLFINEYRRSSRLR